MNFFFRTNFNFHLNQTKYINILLLVLLIYKSVLNFRRMLRICSRKISVSIRTYAYSEIIIIKARKSTLLSTASVHTSATDTTKELPPTFLERIANGFNAVKSSIFKEKNSTVDKKRGVATWNEAISEAEKIIQDGESTTYIDPTRLV